MKLFRKAAIFVLLFATIILVQKLSKERDFKNIPPVRTGAIQTSPKISSINENSEEEEQQLKLQFLSCKAHE